MRGFNRVIIAGNVARDPEVRYTESRQAVAKFPVAVNRKWKGKDGEVREETDFVPISAWGGTAEICERYVKKGGGVLVEGRLRISSYEKDGQKRTFTEVVAASVVLLGGGKSAETRGEPSAQPLPEGFEESVEEVDLPF